MGPLDSGDVCSMAPILCMAFTGYIGFQIGGPYSGPMVWNVELRYANAKGLGSDPKGGLMGF